MLRPCVVTSENLADFRFLLSPELAAAPENLLLIGLEEDGGPCGLLAGAPDGDVFELRSLCVAPAYRRRGGGLRLLEVLLTVLEDEPRLTRVCCRWQDTAETSAVAPLLTAAGFAVTPAAVPGSFSAELPLIPTESLGYLLSDLSED